jgi:hypothetical protein
LDDLGRKSRFGEIATHDLAPTTYALLARDHAILKAQPGTSLFPMTAGHKNPDAATTKLVFDLEAVTGCVATALRLRTTAARCGRCSHSVPRPRRP